MSRRNVRRKFLNNLFTNYLVLMLIKIIYNLTKIVTEKEQLESAIISENKYKYHQTEKSCPFMMHPLKKHFGELGKGPKTDKALQGNYIPNSNLSPQTQRYIELCRLPRDELIINPLTRSLDYFTQSWTKMKERLQVEAPTLVTIRRPQ